LFGKCKKVAVFKMWSLELE